jgi:choline monooxygenase
VAGTIDRLSCRPVRIPCRRAQRDGAGVFSLWGVFRSGLPMSDLSLRLQQATSQLPVASYFDDALVPARTAKHLPGQAPLCGACLGGTGSLRLLQLAAGIRRARPGAHPQRGVELISNVCRHRQALMLQGAWQPAQGPAGQRRRQPGLPTAPLDLQRRRADSRPGPARRATFPQDPCLNLDNYPLQQWNGLLFEAPSAAGRSLVPRRRLARLGPLRRPRFHRPCA